MLQLGRNGPRRLGALYAGAVALGCAGPAATRSAGSFDHLSDQAVLRTTSGELFPGPAGRLEYDLLYRSELGSARAALAVWTGEVSLIETIIGTVMARFLAVKVDYQRGSRAGRTVIFEIF